MRPSPPPLARSRGFGPRIWLGLCAALVALLAYAALTARGGVPDPTQANHLSHGAVIFDSAILVLREGLEAILVLAAITASFRGADRGKRRPVGHGAAAGLAASILTWFVVVLIIGTIGGSALDIQAATGLLAVIVLLVVMNWFFHRMYWTGWIAHHNRRRRELLAGDPRGLRTGLMLLGFSAIYREGFEIVLFLQNLRLKYGALVVLEGVAAGLAVTFALGGLTFLAQQKLPYKRMLVATGLMIGFVLVVMVGESAQELQLAGWLPTTNLGFTLPGWMGTWLAVFPTVETLGAQALAGAAVIGSYLAAERLRGRPARSPGPSVAREERPPQSARARASGAVWPLSRSPRH